MTKPAYMIIGIDVRDDEKLGEYAAGTMPILDAYGGTVLAATNDVELVDGNWTRGRVAVLKFPSMEKARAFWTSDDYKPMKALRESFSDQDNILVEGMLDEDPDAPAADEGTPHYMLGGNDTKNPDWIPEYQAKVPPISARYGLQALIATDQLECLDGAWPRQQMVLLKFPSEEAYRGFWSDPEYIPMKELREANTEGDHITFSGGV